MLETSFIGTMLPFQWAQFSFMQNALLAVLITVPLFTLLGTMVVNNRMAFFSDTLGHSALTGIAIGVLAGIANPIWSMLIFAAFMALSIIYIKNHTGAATDTILGVFSATAIALGIAILSKGGGFARYTRYLIGDLLSITPFEITALFCVLIVTVLLLAISFNQLLMVSINPSLASSRGVNVRLIEVEFALILAMVVTVSIQWIGILIINSLLVLPAAAARNWSRNMRSYHLFTLLISLLCGITGLILSFYLNMATGATIVLLTAIVYVGSLFVKIQ